MNIIDGTLAFALFPVRGKLRTSVGGGFFVHGSRKSGRYPGDLLGGTDNALLADFFRPSFCRGRGD